ncbi:cupin domain-containing protein [Candidatus Tachikawaea gelatinosa]|uniref:Oxalate decarboxylase n=1 Tax=Candidatus Tachikawaea gelatinosa TaxID=1410383 RepID=A0A090AJ95_9ENTR|nr:cupin domain-containing protein [Candidatus Tachikawaea gelatinosa]BAP58513.1 oxalate decarboxylase [Candidatus Tachikawaea gelatinosa]
MKSSISRRNFITLAASSALALTLNNVHGKNINNFDDQQKSNNFQKFNKNQTLINSEKTDNGTLPNLKFSFKDAHIRYGSGGWTRQVTKREIKISHTIAGVNMRLYCGGIRELHWHKESEWAYMIYGKARITALDVEGKFFIKDIQAGDLWYFPSAIPHSIQGMEPDGCEFLLVFDNGNFDEDSTFLLSDWLKHVPIKILSKNFNLPEHIFYNLPTTKNKYIFSGKISNYNEISNNIKKKDKSATKFYHNLYKQNPIALSGGTVRIADSSNFFISKTISAALIELQPKAIRELHWHPNNDEWQYYISGTGKLGIFASSNESRTYNVKQYDVVSIPYGMGHYIENIGNTLLIFLEIFKSSYYSDISLNQWLSNTPKFLLEQHLNINKKFIKNICLQKNKQLIIS